MSFQLDLRRLRAAAKRRKAEPRPIGDQNTESENNGKKARVSEPTGSSIEAEQKGWHPKEDRHHRIERFYWGLTAILTALAVAGAIATVIISNWTLQEARKATGEAHNQAIEAKRQADVAERSFVENDRPIFSINFTNIDLLGEHHSSAPSIRILANNIGSKPGLIYQVRAAFDVQENPPDGMMHDDCHWNLGIKTTEPSHALFVECKGETLTFAQARDISDRKKQIYITGLLEFKSTYGAHWFQYFSFYWFNGDGADNPARIEVTPGSKLNYETRIDRHYDK